MRDALAHKLDNNDLNYASNLSIIQVLPHLFVFYHISPLEGTATTLPNLRVTPCVILRQFQQRQMRPNLA